MPRKNDINQDPKDGDLDQSISLESHYDNKSFSNADILFENLLEDSSYKIFRESISSLSTPETKADKDLKSIKEEPKIEEQAINDKDANKEFNNNFQNQTYLGKKTNRSKSKSKKSLNKNKKKAEKKINNKIKLHKIRKPSNIFVNINKIKKESDKIAKNMKKIDKLKTYLFDSLFETFKNYSEYNEDNKLNEKIREFCGTILTKENLLIDIPENEKDEIESFLGVTSFEYFKSYLKSLNIEGICGSIKQKSLEDIIDGLINLINPSEVKMELEINNNLQEEESSEDFNDNLTNLADGNDLDSSKNISNQSIDNEKTKNETDTNKMNEKESIRKDDLRNNNFETMTIDSFKKRFNELNSGSYQLPAKLPKLKEKNVKNNQKQRNANLEKYKKFMLSSFKEIVVNYKEQNNIDVKENDEAFELMQMKKAEYIKQITNDQKKKEEFYDMDVQSQNKKFEANYCRYLAYEVYEQKSLDGLILLTKIFKANKGYLRIKDSNYLKELIAKLEEVLQIERIEEFEYDENRGKALKEIADESVAYLEEIGK